jgi:hypothetical protein
MVFCNEDNEITSDNNDTTDDLGFIVRKNNGGRNIKKERNRHGNFDSIKSLADYITDTHEKNELKKFKIKKEKKKESIENMFE